MAAIDRTESAKCASAKQKKQGWWLELALAGGLAWLSLLLAGEHFSSGKYLWLFGATYNAGVVQPGQVLTHRVWVYNPTLSIYEIATEALCGCTVVEGRQRNLAPMTALPLTIRIDTTGKYKGKQLQQLDLIVRDTKRKISWLSASRFGLKLPRYQTIKHITGGICNEKRNSRNTAVRLGHSSNLTNTWQLIVNRDSGETSTHYPITMREM